MKAFKKLFSIIFIFIAFSSLHAETYKVVKGDTFYSISKKFGITLQELYSANNLNESSVLKVDQVLTIPNKNEKSSDVKPVQTAQYKVVKGDTLYSIAKANNATVDEIKKLNNFGENPVIKIDQVLVIPANNAIAKDDKTKNTQSTSSSTTPKTATETSTAMADPRTYDTNKKGNTNLVWPVKALDVTYVTGKISGVVITTEKNANVTAIKGGKVVYCGVYRGFGQVVFVQTDTGYIYVYSGLDSISVSNGDKIAYGGKLGVASVDSLSQKTQVTLMVYLNGKVQDPAKVPRG